MSKFLNLIEQFHPENTEDPKWKLVEFLKSKGIQVSVVNDTDVITINTGSSQIPITISSTEEDSQEMDEVRNIAKDPSDPLQSKAKQVTDRLTRLEPKIVNKAKERISQMEKSVNSTY